MGAESGFEFGGGTLLESLDDGFVFFLFLGETVAETGGAGAFRGVDAGDLDVGVEALIELAEAAGGGDIEEGEMEFEITLFVLAHGVGVANGAGEGGEEIVEAGGGVGSPTGEGAAAGEGFEGEANLEGFGEVFGRDGGDVGAGAGVDFDEAFDGQLLEGMADGGEADAELGAEFVGEEALAWGEVVGEDGGAEGFVDFVGGAFFAQGSEGHGVRVAKSEIIVVQLL